MKILVPLKRVIDYRVPIKLRHNEIETNTKYITNPFDEIALEEAIRIKEKLLSKKNIEVITVSIGNEDCKSNLRNSLALGADKSIHIISNQDESKFVSDSINIAKILTQIVNEEKPNLVIMGKQATDSDSSQVGPMLAGILNWPQVISFF